MLEQEANAVQIAVACAFTGREGGAMGSRGQEPSVPKKDSFWSF